MYSFVWYLNNLVERLRLPLHCKHHDTKWNEKRREIKRRGR